MSLMRRVFMPSRAEMVPVRTIFLAKSFANFSLEAAISSGESEEEVYGDLRREEINMREFATNSPNPVPLRGANKVSATAYLECLSTLTAEISPPLMEA